MARKIRGVQAASPPSQATNGNARNLIWMFGSARTGSTWLASMMGEMEGQEVWHEPLVGALFGDFYHGRAQRRANKSGIHFIMGEDCSKSWLGSIKEFVLSEAASRFPRSTRPGAHLVIKEPNGTIGAPVILASMPESRLILLVRDPRDVVASSMNARDKGGWRDEQKKAGTQEESLAASDPDTFTARRSRLFLQQVGDAKEAYDSHEGPKVLVRYEDLRADTLGTMKRMYTELSMEVDEDALARSVAKHSWENIPEEEKGDGKFYRKATPGGWREDLTGDQARTVERITAPLMREFQYDTSL